MFEYLDFALAGFFIFFWLAIMIIGIGATIFWILMLIDAAKRKFPKPDDKTVWILIVALLGVIGAIVYYFVVKRKK